MHKALNETLASLPDDTKVFVCFLLLFLPLSICTRSHCVSKDPQSDMFLSFQPGHEYTKSNVKFGISVMPYEAVEKLQHYANTHEQTQGQFTIADEKVLST